MSDLSEMLANAKGDRSIDDIAAQASRRGYRISRAVVAKYLRGEHGQRPPESTLQGLAAGLDLDVRDLRATAGRQRGELGPWTPPDVAGSLTQDQRAALDLLIKSIVSERSAENAQRSAPITHAGASPAADALEARRARRLNQPGVRDDAARSNQHGQGRVHDAEFDALGEDNQDEGSDGA